MKLLTAAVDYLAVKGRFHTTRGGGAAREFRGGARSAKFAEFRLALGTFRAPRWGMGKKCDIPRAALSRNRENRPTTVRHWNRMTVVVDGHVRIDGRAAVDRGEGFSDPHGLRLHASCLAVRGVSRLQPGEVMQSSGCS